MKKVTTTFWIIAGAIVLFILFFSGKSFITLKPGEKGVVFKPFFFFFDKDNVYNQGFHVIAPWNKLIVYNVLEQNSEELMDVLDKNGLSISMDVSIRFNPKYERIGYLHEKFGVEYIRRLIVPEARSTVRRVAGRYTAEEIYSTKRKELEQAIVKETAEVLGVNEIEMKALLIRSINLPEQIKVAIENKLKQEQEALAYQYKLEREKSEAERKRIAAEGEARANKIINSSLTKNLLKMRGIEATIKLSESPNSKVVVVGSGKDGLPLILGGNN